MIQGFYSAAVGAQQQMLRMDVQGNNIANVNTGGFRSQTPTFQALMYGMTQGLEGNLLPRGSGSYMSSTTTDWAEAPLQGTGRSLDYAIAGEGFFALYDPATGEISYTRDGSFTMSEFTQGGEGVYYLSDGEGRQVLDAAGQPIPVTNAQEALPIGVFQIQYLDGLERVGSSRFLVGEKNGQVWATDTQVFQGMLEGSNTDLATELTRVIEAQRSYSYALKMMQTADEVETTINGIING